MTDRVLPHSLDAERSVLGAVLLDQAVFDVVIAILPSGALFFRNAHARIWDAMIRLRQSNTPIEFLTLRDALVRSQDLEDVGGQTYVAGLVDGVPRLTNIDYYATKVRELHQLRQIIFAANKIISDAYGQPDDVASFIDDAERQVMAIGTASGGGEFVMSAPWMSEMCSAIETNVRLKRDVTGLPTGIPKLDRMTRGMQPGQLWVIGARPSVGKTALMMQLARHAASYGLTLIFSLEMARVELGYRIIALESSIDATRLMTGMLSPREQREVAAAMQRLSEMPIGVDDVSGQVDAVIRAKARRAASRHGQVGSIWVDYTQLIESSKTSENRQQDLAKSVRSMKNLARELKCPVGLLSQISRDADKATNKRPQLHQLKETGALEQDADVVLLLHRPGKFEDGQRYEDNEEAEIIVAKQRNGPIGEVKVRWRAQLMRFDEQLEQPGLP
jgi:replicative DNA helicase